MGNEENLEVWTDLLFRRSHKDCDCLVQRGDSEPLGPLAPDYLYLGQVGSTGIPFVGWMEPPQADPAAPSLPAPLM